MAKTTGPLFSLEASGTVGKTVTYSHWKGRPYVRRRVIPLNPFETDQVAARNRIRVMAAGMFWANHTAQILSGESDTDKVRIKAITPDDVAWNGYLVDKGIGPGATSYTEAGVIWNGLSPGEMTAWDDAAAALVPPIDDVPQGQAGGGFGAVARKGMAFLNYMYALYKMELYTLPTAVPPTYA
jgi:hypothetical protein